MDIVWVLQRHNVAWGDMDWRFVGVFSKQIDAMAFCERHINVKLWRDSEPGELQGIMIEGEKMWFNVMSVKIDDLVGYHDRI